MTDEEPRPVLPAPDAMRRVARQLREITAYQSLQPLEKILAGRVRTVVAACMDELARIREDPALVRERRLEDRADDLAILATSRRLPLEAVEALVRAADRDGRDAIPVEEIRRALLRTEADFER